MTSENKMTKERLEELKKEVSGEHFCDWRDEMQELIEEVERLQHDEDRVDYLEFKHKDLIWYGYKQEWKLRESEGRTIREVIDKAMEIKSEMD